MTSMPLRASPRKALGFGQWAKRISSNNSTTHCLEILLLWGLKHGYDKQLTHLQVWAACVAQCWSASSSTGLPDWDKERRDGYDKGCWSHAVRRSLTLIGESYVLLHSSGQSFFSQLFAFKEFFFMVCSAAAATNFQPYFTSLFASTLLSLLNITFTSWKQNDFATCLCKHHSFLE